MTRALLVRHGQSVPNTRPERICGHNEGAQLTATGREQSITFGSVRDIPGAKIDAFYHSTARRTRDTGLFAMHSAGITVTDFITNSRLNEVSQGANEGRLRSEVYTPDAVQALRSKGLDGKLPGTESLREAQERMWQALACIYREHPEGNVMIFTHGLVTRAMVGALGNLTRDEILALEIDNLGETCIDITSTQRASVEYVGKTYK